MPVRRFLAGKSADARSEPGTAPGAKSGNRWRTRASELDHRRPSVRRQAADHCPPEPRANPRRMSELALFGNGASPHFRLRLKKQTQQNARNRIPILRRKTAFMFEGKKAFPHSDNL